MPICPNCGNQAAENAVFCDQCGTRMPAPEPEPAPAVPSAGVATTGVAEAAGGVPDGVLTCPDCGAENVPGMLFCDECGSPLESPAPAAEEPPADEPLVVEEPAFGVEPIVEAEPAVDSTAVEVEPVVQVEPVVEAAPVTVPTAQGEVYCPTCGAEVEPGESFCANCGASLDAAAPEPEIVPEEPILDETPLPAAPLVDEAEVLIEEVVIEESVAEAAPVADEPQCPVCGANVLPDQTFCAGCGAALEPTAAPEAPAPDTVVEPEEVIVPEPVPAAPLAPAPGPEGAAYLEVADSGAHIPLVDQPALLLGRLDEISGIYPDIDLTPHGGDEAGVSRRHAQLLHEGDAWYVLDLDSTNGTFLNGVELAAKTRSLLSDGDQLMMGELQLVFHAH